MGVAIESGNPPNGKLAPRNAPELALIITIRIRRKKKKGICWVSRLTKVKL